MRQLTKKSEFGAGYSIESGTVPEVISKLGELENNTFDRISEICDGYCKHRDLLEGIAGGQERLDAICADCPVEKIADMLWRE